MSLFNELKRRNVFRVGLAYMVSAWIIAQVASLVLDSIKAPDWVMQVLLLGLGLGFIVALIIAWAYELTPEGIKKKKDVVRDDSISTITAKKLDYITLAGVLLVVVLFAYQQMNDKNMDSRLRGNDGVGAGNYGGAGESAKINSEKTPVIPAQAGTSSGLPENPITVQTNNKSIAILPFTNMANNPENEPFTLGLHDDLLTHLSKISALKVISRTSVMEYKETTKKIKEIAKELGVANVLEGGVQRSGNQIRLNVQLIDAKTDEHLWAEKYDRELTTQNIFKIQTEISKAIAAALKAQLTPAENISLAKIPTNNLEAYNAYLAARQLMAKREGKSLKQALNLFQKATQLDANYALAYVGQASVLRLLRKYSDLPSKEMFAQGEPLIAKALEFEPLLPFAHMVKADYLVEKQQYQAAEEKYKYALSLNPNDAQTYHFYAYMLRQKLGRAKEALAMHRKAAELDPLSNVILVNLGYSLMANGMLQEAMTQFDSVHRLNPKFPGALDGLGWFNIAMGNYSQAIIQQNKAIILDPGYIQGRLWLFLHTLDSGDIPAARAELEKSKAIAPEFFSYPQQESLLDMLSGRYQVAQQRYIKLHKKEPDNNYYKNNLGFFSLVAGDCKRALEMWQEFNTKVLNTGYVFIENDLEKAIDLAWCLNQSRQKSTAENLLARLQKYLNNNPTRIKAVPDMFMQVSLWAIQGKTTQAANAYAEIIESKKTKGWFWLDHKPYFADLRKDPVYIKAHQQLMQDLQKQRDLVAEYYKKAENKEQVE